MVGQPFWAGRGGLATGRHSGKTDSWLRVRKQPFAKVFVFAVAGVFHLCPTDFPKLEMWLFTPKAAISHPHLSPHTHIHAHTLTLPSPQRGNLPSPGECLPSHWFPALPAPRPWEGVWFGLFTEHRDDSYSAIPTFPCCGVGVCKPCGCVSGVGVCKPCGCV